MKVIFITSSYLPVLGGLQEAVSQLARELSTTGHDVSVLTNRYPRALKRHEDIDGISVTRMLFSGFHLASLNPHRVAKFIVGLMIGFSNSFRLLILLKNKRPDIINIHFLGSQAPYAMIASKLLGIKCIVSLHGDDVEGLPQRSRIDRWLFRRVLTASDYVTACSGYLLDEVKKIVPEIGSKATAIHNGIRLEEFQNVQPYTHVRPYIFAAGRLVYKKGFDILLSAYRSILDKGVKVDLILAGDGPEKEKLLGLALDLGLPFMKREKDNISVDGGRESGNIILWGRAERTEMRSLMKSCELFVIPSRKEPFGIVGLEAIAAGKKVVAARTGGLTEVLQEGKGGYFFEVGDVIGLTEAIGRALSDKPPLARSLCSWKETACSYMNIMTRSSSRHTKQTTP